MTAKWRYGCFQMGRNRVLGAHRVAWIFTNGDPGPLCVLHRCDNRVCVNPAHLFLGTKQDNKDDCVAKGRHSRGATTRINKLTDRHITEIRALRGVATQRAIAARFGVDQSTIGAVLSRRTWKHVK